MQFYGCSIGAKFQMTIPKEVRAALGIRHKGEMVGFAVDGAKVSLTKARMEPEESFTAEEWHKILKLAHEKPSKTFHSADAFLKDMKKITSREKSGRS